MKLSLDIRVRRPGFTLAVATTLDAAALAVVGPSGSGKSTLLRVLAGLDRPRGARVELDGRDLARLPVHARRAGCVWQDPLLFPHLTVRRNLTFGPRARSLGSVPDALGIGHLLDRMPRHLSGGEARRVALGRALLSAPDILLLDEPFSGLDATLRRDALSLVQHTVVRAGLPLVLVSHRAGEVAALADVALRLRDGAVDAQGPAAQLVRADDGPVDCWFVGVVTGPGQVRAGTVVLHAAVPDALAVPGQALRLACGASDVLLAPPGWSGAAGLSARNAWRTTVAAATTVDGLVLAQLADPPGLCARVTAASAAELQLAPGAAVTAIVKATALQVLGPGS